MAGKAKVKMEVPYFQVPNAIYEMQDLDLYEKAVYIYLCRCGNQGAKAFPSYQTIAEKTGMSRYKAIKVIDSLIQKEYIKKKPRNKDGARASNVYYVDNLVNRVDHLVNNVDLDKEPIIKNKREGFYRIGNRYYINGKRVSAEEYQVRCFVDVMPALSEVFEGR